MKNFISLSGKIKSQRGFTLVEALVASLLSVIVLGSLMVTTVFVSKSFKETVNYNDLDQTSRNALDNMSRDIRNAAGVSMSVFRTNNITLTNSDGSSFSYRWDSSDTTLKRYFTNFGSTTPIITTMLTNCDTLSFYFYRQVPGNDLTFSQITDATTLNETKLINVDWRCSRTIMGAKLNTESVQTAQITIRN